MLSRVLTIILIFTFTSSLLFAQMGDEVDSERGRGPGSDKSGAKPEEADDSIAVNVVSYRLKDLTSKRDLRSIDSTLFRFHVDDEAMKRNPLIQNLGNTGSAYQSMLFFDRPDDSYSVFSRYSKDYRLQSSDQTYFGTATPYTNIAYTQNFQNTSSENTLLSFLHSQNVDEFTNVGIQYRTRAADGQYINQKQKTYYFNIFGGYRGHRYSLHISYVINHTSAVENGGLVTVDNLLNPDLDPDQLIVWLDGATSSLSGSYSTITQQLKLGRWTDITLDDGVYEVYKSKISLNHTFDYSREQREFSETDPLPQASISDDSGVSEDIFFYGEDHTPNIYDDRTDDYIDLRRITNRVSFDMAEDSLKKYTFSKSIYGGVDLLKYSYPDIEQDNDTVLSIQDLNKYNAFVGAKAGRDSASFLNWNIDARYYLVGYRALDFQIKGELSKAIRSKKDTSLITLYGDMLLSEPDLYEKEYYSNHYQWSNIDFDKEYKLRVGGKFSKPKWDLTLGADILLTSNYIYWNQESLPEQESASQSTFAISVNKGFHLGGVLHSTFNGALQKSTSDKINLPLVSLYNNTYIETQVASVMQINFGFDLRYVTKYYADDYSPAIGQFTVQEETKLGDILSADIYFAFKIKRLMFYTKYKNLNQMWQTRTAHQTTNGYGDQPNELAFGVTWSFYD